MKKCKHKNEGIRNQEVGGYNIPDDCLCEYDIYCKDCGKYLGHWSYGYYDEEYNFNTITRFSKIKHYLEQFISKIKMSKIKDDLPF